MKKIFILRSVPGAGKSTLAKELAGNNGVICEADDYFVDNNGNYNFDASLLHKAHMWCKDKFIDALNNDIETIVVSNTNTHLKDFKEYKELGEIAGYTVFVLVIENHHGGINVHNVPEEKLQEMENRIKNNIKLR